MAKDLKLSLRNKLDQIAPEYGLVELTYPSFTRCYGYLSQPLSACDAVEAVSALLDVAGGVRTRRGAATSIVANCTTPAADADSVAGSSGSRHA